MSGVSSSPGNYKFASLSKRSAIAWLLIGASIISLSPVFGTLLLPRGNLLSIYLLLFVIIIYAFSRVDGFSLEIKEYLIIFLILFFSQINSIYWSLQNAYVTIYVISALIVASKCDVSIFRKYATLMTNLHLLMLFGAWVGFVYTLAGGDALFTIKNPDGRDNGFYLTTFSNSYFLGFIRPSGWYDEPGALSFFICLTVALREVFYMSKTKSWILLLLGLITGSLAHLIFAVIFFFFVKNDYSKVFRAKLSKTILSLFVFVLMASYFSEELLQLLQLYIDRMSIGEDGLAGDSRSELMFNAWGYLNINSFLWGLDGNCISQNSLCQQDAFLKYGENPLSMLVHYGIFISFAYYAALFAIAIKALKCRDFIAFAVFLLLMQRPNVMSFGYSVVIIIYIYSLYGRKSRRLLDSSFS